MPTKFKKRKDRAPLTRNISIAVSDDLFKRVEHCKGIEFKDGTVGDFPGSARSYFEIWCENMESKAETERLEREHGLKPIKKQTAPG